MGYNGRKGARRGRRGKGEEEGKKREKRFKLFAAFSEFVQFFTASTVTFKQFHIGGGEISGEDHTEGESQGTERRRGDGRKFYEMTFAIN